MCGNVNIYFPGPLATENTSISFIPGSVYTPSVLVIDSYKIHPDGELVCVQYVIFDLDKVVTYLVRCNPATAVDTGIFTPLPGTRSGAVRESLDFETYCFDPRNGMYSVRLGAEGDPFVKILEAEHSE